MKKDKKLTIKVYRAFRIEWLNPGKSLVVLTAVCFIVFLVLAVLLTFRGCPSPLTRFDKPAEISIKFNDDY